MMRKPSLHGKMLSLSGAIGLALVMGVSGTAIAYSPAEPAGDNSLIEKRLTKAQCLKKPGYIWIESSKRCVKDTRGSY